MSVALDLDTVPTAGQGRGRRRGGPAGRAGPGPHWEKLTGVDPLGDGLPEHRPGCGSLTSRPRGDRAAGRPLDRAAVPAPRTGPRSRTRPRPSSSGAGRTGCRSSRPTPARVLRMLEGTTRAPDEVVAVVGPDFADCTVEKAAVNAVHGRLPARVPPGGAGRGGGGLHRRVQHARPAVHDLVLRAGRSSSTGRSPPRSA